MLFAGILTFVACYYFAHWFDFFEFPKYIFETVKIVIVMLLCVTIYLLLNIILKMDYAKELINRVLKK